MQSDDRINADSIRDKDNAALGLAGVAIGFLVVLLALSVGAYHLIIRG